MKNDPSSEGGLRPGSRGSRSDRAFPGVVTGVVIAGCAIAAALFLAWLSLQAYGQSVEAERIKAEFTERLEALNNKKANLEKAVAAKREADNMRYLLDEITNQLKEKEGDIVEADEYLEVARGQLEAARREKGDLKLSAEQLERTVAELEKRSDQLSRETSVLEVRETNLKSEIEDLGARRDGLDNRIATLRETNALLDQEFAKLNGMNADVRNATADLNDASGELLEQLKESVSTLASVKEELNRSKGDLAKAVSSITDKDRKLGELHRNMSLAGDAHRGVVNELRADRSSIDAFTGNLGEVVDTLEEHVAELGSQAASHQNALSAGKKAFEVTQTVSEELERLATTIKAISDSYTSIRIPPELVRRLTAVVSELQDQVGVLKTRAMQLNPSPTE